MIVDPNSLQVFKFINSCFDKNSTLILYFIQASHFYMCLFKTSVALRGDAKNTESSSVINHNYFI